MTYLAYLPASAIVISGLVAAIALRRQLGRVFPFAVAAFAVLSVERLGEFFWTLYDEHFFNRYVGRPESDEELSNALVLFDRVWLAFAVISAIGIALLVAAVVVGRSYDAEPATATGDDGASLPPSTATYCSNS